MSRGTLLHRFAQDRVPGSGADWCRPSGHCREEHPLGWHTLQLPLSTIHEVDVGAQDKIFDGSGDQNLSRSGERAHPSSDVYREASEVLAPNLALASVQTYSQLESGPRWRVDDRLTTSDRPRRAVERRDESVACRVQLAPVKAALLVAHGPVALIESLMPSFVAEVGGALRRPDDVSEQTVGQDAVHLDKGALAGDGLSNLVDDRERCRREADVPTGQLDESGACSGLPESPPRSCTESSHWSVR